MTHTTTDAAQARAREVLARAMASKYWGGLVREGKDGNWHVIRPSEAIAAMLAFATTEAASGAGEREADALREALYRAAVDLLHTPRHNRDGAADQHIRESRERIRQSLYPSLPPATDPALREAVVRIESFMSLMMPHLPLSVRRSSEATIVQCANDFADLRAALAAAPTIPATGAVSEAGKATAERCAQIARMCDLYDGDHLRNSDPRETVAQAIEATIPATGEAKMTSRENAIAAMRAYVESAGVPITEFDPEFVVHMMSAMMVSFHKYGRVADAYPLKFSAADDVRARMKKYRETGNKHFLVDAANFAMIEAMHPGRNGGAEWAGNDAADSPGRTTASGHRLVQEANDGTRIMGETILHIPGDRSSIPDSGDVYDATIPATGHAATEGEGA